MLPVHCEYVEIGVRVSAGVASSREVLRRTEQTTILISSNYLCTQFRCYFGKIAQRTMSNFDILGV